MSETEKAPRKKRGKAPAVVDKPEAPKNDWRSQVDEVAAIDSIEPHPENPNKGDRESIGESIDANGFYGKVLVQKSTRRILVGSHRWAEMKAAGETEIPVTLLDVDDDRALAIMVADNETRNGAERNENRLADILARLPSHRGLGIKAPDVAALIERARPKVGYLDLMRANSDAAAADDGDPEEEPDEGDLPDDAEQDLTDFQENDGGPRDDEPAGRAETPRIPLSIVLTNSQERRWSEYKKSIGERRDGDAFLVLLAAATLTDDGE